MHAAMRFEFDVRVVSMEDEDVLRVGLRPERGIEGKRIVWHNQAKRVRSKIIFVSESHEDSLGRPNGLDGVLRAGS